MSSEAVPTQINEPAPTNVPTSQSEETAAGATPNATGPTPTHLASTSPAVEAAGSSSALDSSSFKVYNPPRTAAASPRDLPDSYFEPSAADIRSAQAALHARTQALTDAPFQTRAAREQAEKKKTERWPTTTIRIKFTDRTQLEKTFPSTDKIRSVYAFVRGSLREDVKPVKFVLYQPPKRELKVSDPNVRDLTLAELQLAPSSILLVKFLDEDLNPSAFVLLPDKTMLTNLTDHTTITDPDYPAPLAPSILSLATDLPTPPDYDRTPPPSTPSSSSAAGGSKSSGGGGGGGLGGEKKMPKWFKGVGTQTVIREGRRHIRAWYSYSVGTSARGRTGKGEGRARYQGWTVVFSL
ncbi:uncharacterized protein STEHIDRAFT_152843 [Stereum hirsutum FP-91666 SS1]|uniref:uncharacterized protein n=1 Tax=Stereum hirsutum (strain FP-91666) TaxID=721885 RepID=UPI000440DB07|nr:uncharacterized protein STEHIDRAFT_152843 [Stereum hirsutum FP-91666 SS1]EIM91185.1 hypothetical protein STEHIDRAFT_152843 [Stereum hirsutum FP-91666 SS1]